MVVHEETQERQTASQQSLPLWSRSANCNAEKIIILFNEKREIEIVYSNPRVLFALSNLPVWNDAKDPKINDSVL
jgi:hypothetical protein